MGRALILSVLCLLSACEKKPDPWEQLGRKMAQIKYDAYVSRSGALLLGEGTEDDRQKVFDYEVQMKSQGFWDPKTKRVIPPEDR